MMRMILRQVIFLDIFNKNRVNVVISRTKNVCENLEAEEQLFQSGEETVFLWKNDPVVVVGKFQEMSKEADISFATENRINIVKRSTGGGAVYQDHGNLNLSYICSGSEELLGQKTQSFCLNIVKFLESVGVEAKWSGRNDLVVLDKEGNERKISGSAMKIQEDKLLFHMTLLVNTDCEVMNRVLTPERAKLESKGIASVRSRVITLEEHLNRVLDIDEIMNGFAEFIQQKM